MIRNSKRYFTWVLPLCCLSLLSSQEQLFSQYDNTTHYPERGSCCGGVWCSSEYESFYRTTECNECPTECDTCNECPCEDDPCCKVIEYVDYEPWQEGVDAGLHCLPGSNCHYSCPTKPSGAKLYRYQARLAHKYRYPTERPVEQWKPIMMHMRVLLPMTACSYRKILSFLEGRPYVPEKKPTLAKRNGGQQASSETAALDTESSNDENLVAVLAEDDTGNSNLAEGALEDDLDLEGLIGDVEVADVEFADTPIGGGGWRSRLSHVFTGYTFLDYRSPFPSFFGDFNGNNTFLQGAVPTFMCSYGDSLLAFVRLGAFTFAQETQMELTSAYMAYFYNDYLTLIAGKTFAGFGNFTRYFIGYNQQMITLPLAYGFFTNNFFVQAGGIGVNAQGAIPLCSLSPRLKSASLTYDAFIGNGPSEVNAFTPPSGAPSGTIYLAGDNAPNNNNSFFFSGRIGFLPNDCQIYGVSYQKGRWSSNAKTFGKFGLAQGRKLNFEAAAFDWNIIFNQWVAFRGEYIWAQYENSIPEFQWVRTTSYWAMLNLDLGLLKCVCPKLYWSKPCLWDSLELSLRTENYLRQPDGRTFYTGGADLVPGVYTGKAFDMRRFSVCLGYYFTQTFSLKFQYDINYGDKGVYQFRQFAENFNPENPEAPWPQKKTGFAENVFAVRLIYGW